MIEALLESGASVDSEDADANTALFWAAFKGDAHYIIRSYIIICRRNVCYCKTDRIRPVAVSEAYNTLLIYTHVTCSVPIQFK